ncbi:hypothetical protein D3C83_214670 [compost metagenome]
MAVFASSSVLISTNPNPLLLFVYLSMITCAEVTDPISEKCLLSVSLSVSYDNPATNKFFAILKSPFFK